MNSWLSYKKFWHFRISLDFQNHCLHFEKNLAVTVSALEPDNYSFCCHCLTVFQDRPPPYACHLSGNRRLSPPPCSSMWFHSWLRSLHSIITTLPLVHCNCTDSCLGNTTTRDQMSEHVAGLLLFND